MDRIKTGITGFDDLIQGGIPKGSSVLLAGEAGAGIHLFAGEFLYKNTGTSLYYGFEKREEELIKEFSTFSWDISSRIKEKQFNVIKSELYQFETFVSDLEDNIDKLNATRLVLDSITLIGQFFDDTYKMRKGLIELKEMIKGTGCTALMLSEIPDNSKHLASLGSEEFVLDGVIEINLLRKDSELIRTIDIRKMIGTDQDTAIHPFEITKKGLKVHKIREIL